MEVMNFIFLAKKQGELLSMVSSHFQSSLLLKRKKGRIKHVGLVCTHAN